MAKIFVRQPRLIPISWRAAFWDGPYDLRPTIFPLPVR